MAPTKKRYPEFADFTPAEAPHVRVIVSRAMLEFGAAGVKRTETDVEMDLSAVHARNPLRLEELSRANEFNFAHDIFGIYRHLNRQTGELEDFFSPRFTRRA